jgi:hypothetical protein
MNAHEPGTVAMVTAYNARTPYRAAFDGKVWRSLRNHDLCVISPTTIRPLVVLDLDDPAATVAYLKEATDGFSKAAHGMDAWVGRQPIREVWGQIEQQTKPRMSEPKGVGAVVEVDGGVRFVRIHDGYWISEDERQTWDNLNPVRVLSEGVTA